MRGLTDYLLYYYLEASESPDSTLYTFSSHLYARMNRACQSSDHTYYRALTTKAIFFSIYIKFTSKYFRGVLLLLNGIITEIEHI